MEQKVPDSFATTVQETSRWLQSVESKIAPARVDKDLAWAVLGATLHAVRDRLQPGAAIHLGAQLPMLVRGLYYEHWHPSPDAAKERHKQQFLEHVREQLPADRQLDPEAAARAVFGVMHEKLDSGQIAKLARQMPKELRDLWPPGS